MFGVKKLIRGPIHQIIAFGPFQKWGLDFVGPLPRSSTGHVYILVATDYMTRWAEAKATTNATTKTVVKFILVHL